MSLPPPERLAADLRALRLLWAAVSMGVVVIASVAAGLVLSGQGGGALPPDVPFYVAAVASVLTIVVAFQVQKRLAERVLPQAASYDAAAQAIRTHGLLSLAVMEGGAFVAAVMAFLGGELTPLAFVVPYVAFAWLFFPSEARYTYLLSCTPLAGGRRPN